MLDDALPSPCRTLLAVGEVDLAGRADVVTAVAAVPDAGEHEAVVAVDAVREPETDLRGLADRVAPGGVLVVLGRGRSRSGWDLAHDAAGLVAHRGPRPPVAPASYTQVLRTATLLLPGCRYRRHGGFRYSLVWTRP